MRFGLIGDGGIAKIHRQAISILGGEVAAVYDPIKYPDSCLDDRFFDVDVVCICSPTPFHYEHLKISLKYNVIILCEKPLVLPWQPLIDDDRINIVLPYRWAELPKKIDQIDVCMIRDRQYFSTWKGDPYQTGGIFYNLFIHYIDLAILHGSKFSGVVCESGNNFRKADNVDLFSFDMTALYVNMYSDVISGKGLHPSSIFFLTWFLDRQNFIHGFGPSIFNKRIDIDNFLP